MRDQAMKIIHHLFNQGKVAGDLASNMGGLLAAGSIINNHYPLIINYHHGPSPTNHPEPLYINHHYRPSLTNHITHGSFIAVIPSLPGGHGWTRKSVVQAMALGVAREVTHGAVR